MVFVTICLLLLKANNYNLMFTSVAIVQSLVCSYNKANYYPVTKYCFALVFTTLQFF